MSTAGIVKTSSSVGLNLGKWAWKNKYLLLIIFSFIPVLITAIHVSQETNNPSYIFVSAGLSVINADTILYEDVYILETNPSELIGMEKPEKGIWKKTKYFFKTFRVVWLVLGLVSMITLPFVFFRWIWNKTNESTKTRSLILGLITTFLFLFISNLIIINVSGNPLYNIDANLDFFQKAKQIIHNSFPLKGFVSLIKYIIGFF